MIFIHDSRSEQYRNPAGALPCAGKVRLRVFAEDLTNITLRMWWDDTEHRFDMRRLENNFYEYEVDMPQTAGLLWYYFIGMDKEGCTWYLGNARDGLGGEGSVEKNPPASFQITVYDPAYRTPEWMRESVMMQIFVDRFHNAGGMNVHNLPFGSYYHAQWDDDPSLVINDRRGNCSANDFFGGNLKGVEEKLDYISSMGVKALYFNPIFKANSNHKYDTGDYMQIDPTFGTEADFKRLCKAAKKKGIRIVLDGVFSHTGDDSVYFDRYGNYGGKGAYNDPNSPYSSWYSFTNWPNDYVSWWGFKTLPNVNEEDPAFKKFIITGDDSVIEHWMKAGAGGWRLDVADELPMEFIRDLRKREKEIDPDAALIGEVWEDPSNKVAYGQVRCYCTGDTLDATMNYPLREAILGFLLGRFNSRGFVRRVESLRENQPNQFFYSQMNLLSSHDRPRALAVLANVGNMEPERIGRRPIELEPEQYDLGKKRLMAAWKLICALPGMPCLYYGDEAGMYSMSDPYCRGTYPWGREDKALLESFREAAQWRNANPVLRTGGMKLISAGEDVVIVERSISGGRDVFGRKAKDSKLVLAVNRARKKRWVEYDGRDWEIPALSAKVLA